MTRIPAIDPTSATGKTAELFTAVKGKLGMVPNLMRTFGQSPAVLEAYLAFSNALAGGVLPARVREQIALTIAEANESDYCLAAHSMIGKGEGLSPESIANARRAQASDPKIDALLKFARTVVSSRGHVDDSEIDALRSAGVSDAEIIEVIANVSLSNFTNYTNHIAGTEIDFPNATPMVVSA